MNFLRIFSIVLTFTPLTAMAATAGQSNWEGRAQFGQLVAKPDNFNKQMEDFVKDTPDMPNAKTSGVDILYRLSSKPLVFGIRYEVFNYDKAGEGSINGSPVSIQTKFNGSRLGLLAGYRFVNSANGYIGLLGHVGLIQDMKYTIESKQIGSGTTHTDSFKGKPETGYSLGLEAAFLLQQKLLLGAEVGYTSYVSNKFDSETTEDVADKNGNAIKMDLSGGYFKVFVGITF